MLELNDNSFVVCADWRVANFAGKFLLLVEVGLECGCGGC